MLGAQRAGRAGPRWRILVPVVGAALAADILLWSAHVFWRDTAMGDLGPVLHEIEALADQIAADDAWLSKNQRLLEGYGEHEELARRLTDRGRRIRAYAALVEAYNRRVEELYRRFYFAPVPAPRPPLLDSSRSRTEGIFPTRQSGFPRHDIPMVRVARMRREGQFITHG
jgi:hypothetical protein